jgi:predicted Fe-Mo cluster-binding NifX family protein
MKMAAVSEDGIIISQHFGRAPFYVVTTIEDWKIIAQEKRDKLGHAHFAGETHADHDHAADHSSDLASQSRHARMAEAIADCQILLARGMGSGAYKSMGQANIQPVVTVITNFDDAIKAYLHGTIVDHIEKLH